MAYFTYIKSIKRAWPYQLKSGGQIMIKLHDGGVYLINGQTLIPDDGQAAAAIEKETGPAVTREEAARRSEEHTSELQSPWN